VSTENAMVALILDQLGQTLVAVFQQGVLPFGISFNANDTLMRQLANPDVTVPRVSLGFVRDIATTSAAALLDTLNQQGGRGGGSVFDRLDPAELLGRLRQELGNRLTSFGKQQNAIASFIAARDPSSLENAVAAIWSDILSGGASGGAVFARDRLERLKQFIGNDVGAVLSLATIVNAVQGSQQGLQNIATVPESVEQGLLMYFFRADGYRTVDGERVVAPVHLSDVRSALAGASSMANFESQLQGLFSKPTAERYIRDVTRVIVESAYDAGRGLRSAYDEVTGGLGKLKTAPVDKTEIVTKFVSWFRGFSSIAESTVMRAVEVGTQGVSQFQTNPLIAAAAGGCAGTVARKIAQDSFLSLLRTELRGAPAT
jgi:hypothetical protein